jgi:hypothetical protein
MQQRRVSATRQQHAAVVNDHAADAENGAGRVLAGIAISRILACGKLGHVRYIIPRVVHFALKETWP